MKYDMRIGKDGIKYWYFNGEFHREDGPAVIYPEGTKYWYLNGKLHREDGPAAIWADGSESWFLNGKPLTSSEIETIKAL